MYTHRHITQIHSHRDNTLRYIYKYTNTQIHTLLYTDTQKYTHILIHRYTRRHTDINTITHTLTDNTHRHRYIYSYT